MPHNLIKGKSPDVIDTNVRTLMDSGKHSHASALRCAMCYANKNHTKTVKRVSGKVVKKDPDRVKVT